jgi:prepilin-type N-terminal cleavage/methylation domain-containing protein
MNPLAIARRMAFLRFPGTARLFAVSLLARSLPSGAKAKRSAARPLDRRGVTLIELMVALAITMIMMTAVITLFSNVTTTVSNSRALIEISERLRTARNRLQLDLAGHTATTIPPLRPEDGEGYLEIIEGPNSDAGSYVPNPNTPPYGVPSPINGTTVSYAVSASGSANEIMGDADDVLMLTVRSQAEPFVGWAAGGVLTESNTAEVIWYAVPNGRSLPGDSTAFNGAPVQLFTLYRRVLLVAPLVVPSGKPFTANNPGSISQFYNQ